MRGLTLIALLAIGPGCASRRVLELENTVLRDRVTHLEQEVSRLQASAPDPEDYSTAIDLDLLATWLDRAGVTYTRTGGGSAYLRIEYSGHNATFAVTVQVFPQADVVYLATSGWLAVGDAASTDAVVVLLVQIAAINYELLVGKLQLNPETGEVLLSTELHARDGLGYRTFIEAVAQLCDMADAHTTQLRAVIDGQGI